MFESKPAYMNNQPAYLNTVCAISTALTPAALLHELKRVEWEIGRRDPRVRWDTREIDLDLIVYEDVVLGRAQVTKWPHTLG